MNNEQRKAERVKVLGVSVDRMKVERAVSLTGRYLEKHKFEYIVFANTPAALDGQEEAVLKDYIDRAALVLPGDGNIEDAVEVSKYLDEGVSYQAEYFRRLLNRLYRQHGSVYIMAENEKRLLKIRTIFKEKYKRIPMEAILWQDEESVDKMVNGINSFAPALLMIIAPHRKIQAFLSEHACKVNAGLCICMEEAVTDREWNGAERLAMTRFQKFCHDLSEKISQSLHNFLFAKQMKQIQNTENTEHTDSEEEMQEEEKDC